jgi:hypothetical protein
MFLKPWMIIALTSIACIALVACLLQILWLRGKLNDYSVTKLASEMEMKNRTPYRPNASIVEVYSAIMDVALTRHINNKTVDDYLKIVDMVLPQAFNIINVCGSEAMTLKMSCNKVDLLVLNITEGGSRFALDVASNLILYVMLNGNLYMPRYDKTIDDTLHTLNPLKYKDKQVVALYTIDSKYNVPIEGAYADCAIALTPFIGQISNDQSPAIGSWLPASDTRVSMPIHIASIRRV